VGDRVSKVRVGKRIIKHEYLQSSLIVQVLDHLTKRLLDHLGLQVILDTWIFIHHGV
jgi:hypothetical protein